MDAKCERRKPLLFNHLDLGNSPLRRDPFPAPLVGQFCVLVDTDRTKVQSLTPYSGPAYRKANHTAGTALRINPITGRNR